MAKKVQEIQEGQEGQEREVARPLSSVDGCASPDGHRSGDLASGSSCWAYGRARVGASGARRGPRARPGPEVLRGQGTTHRASRRGRRGCAAPCGARPGRRVRRGAVDPAAGHFRARARGAPAGPPRSGQRSSPRPRVVQPLAIGKLHRGAAGSPGHRPGRRLVGVEHLGADEGTGRRPCHRARIRPSSISSACCSPTTSRSAWRARTCRGDRFPTLLDLFEPTGSLYRAVESLGVVYTEGDPNGSRRSSRARGRRCCCRRPPPCRCLLMQRVSRDQHGVPIERVRSLYRGDRIGFRTLLKR